MLKKIRTLLGKTKDGYKSAYLWTGMQSIMAALQSIVIMAVCTRTCGINDAGVFAIGFAIANLMYYIGLFGVRRYQATDLSEEHSFQDYNGARVFTCILMMLGCLGYCVYGIFFNGYNADKFIVIMLICIFKCIMAYDDMYHGRMQQCDMLHVAARIATFRYIICLGICCVMLVETNDLVVSMAVYTGIYLVLTIVLSANAATDFGSIRPEFHRNEIKSIIIACFPLCVAAFLSNYIGNASKYAIEAYLNDTMQAYYGYIFMPAFAINLITNFIFNPMLTKYARIWEETDIKLFVKKIERVALLILLVTLGSVAIAYLIGIPVLSLVFGVNLEGYRGELCIAIIGGGMFAYSTFFMNIVTIIREQQVILVAYIIVTAITLAVMKYFITKWLIMGGVLLYGISMTALAVSLLIIMAVKIRGYYKKETENTIDR